MSAELHARTGSPRLLNMRQAAAYLGLSYWSLRDYVLAGLIPVVALPPLRPREGERARTTLRRVLVDRGDLDAFIDARKRGCAQDIQSDAPQDAAGNTRANRVGVPAVCPPSEADWSSEHVSRDRTNAKRKKGMNGQAS